MLFLLNVAGKDTLLEYLCALRQCGGTVSEIANFL